MSVTSTVRGAPLTRRGFGGAGVVLAAFGAGAVPFSNIGARVQAGVDLRAVGNGTVSGTNLYEVAGFRSLALAGVCDVAKGAVGPLLAGPDRPVVSALSGGVAVAGHNWSPFLSGAGGRGISPALGALAVNDWPGSVLLLASLAAGRLAKQTALVMFVADAALVPLLARRRGWRGALAGACVVAPMLAKRATGNRPLPRSDWRGRAERLLFDRDPQW
jgi:glycerol-3-phosphate acyltransferase PlsY